MREPKTALGLVVGAEVPNEIDFACPDCGASCKTFPKTRAVVHAIPTCAAWQRVGKDRDKMSMFVIRGGVELAFNRPVKP